MNVLRIAVVALAAAAAFAACTQTRAGLLPELRASTSSRLPAGRVALSVTVDIRLPALHATSLRIYAYRMDWRGPKASPPPTSLVATANVGKGASGCANANGIRSCAFAANVPKGNVAIVARLYAKNRLTGTSFVAMDAASPSPLALAAGDVPITNLTVTPPSSLAGGSFHAGVTLLSKGAAVLIDPARTPVAVRAYGPPSVIASPQAMTSRDGTATLTYGGKPFVNAMTVAAIAGTISNTAQIFPSHSVPPACAPLSDTPVFAVPEPTIYPAGFSLRASVAGSAVVSVGLDTGSTTFAIAKTKLSGAQASELIGPGQSAQQTYEPSGITIKGNYYLAPVTLYDRTGRHELGTTVPMEVFVTTQACDKSGSCSTDTSTAYLGVGFGRPAPNPSKAPGLMDGPEENAFLQLAPIVQGTMHPGFGLTPTMLTIGQNRSTEKAFPLVRLTPFPDRPGDWRGPPACVRFNGSGGYQCGRMLLDIGINSMFVTAVRPASINEIEIAAPSAQRPLLHYAFDYPVRPGATPPAPNGNASVPVQFDGTPPPVFVNTGRDALAAAAYIYDAGCGVVGLQPVSREEQRP